MKSGLLYALITAIVFATFEPVAKLVATDFSPIAMCIMRFLIGGLIFLPYSLYEMKKQKISLTLMDHIKMMGLGILFICISMPMLQYSIKFSSSPALIAIIFSANSLMIIVISGFVLKERFTLKKIIALLACVIGFVVCSWDSFMAKSEASAVIIAVLSAFVFSIYAVINKKMMKKASGNILVGFSFMYGSIILLIVNWLFRGDFVTTDTVSVKSVLIVLYIGIIVTGVGYWAYFKALKYSATMASLSYLIKPALSPFVAVILNGVPVSASMIIGLVLVLAGSYVVSYTDNKVHNTVQGK